MRCAACGEANPDSARFCNQCGASLRGVPSIRRDTLAGERKQVTVLFADVKGSMALAAGMDEEEWSELMERFLALLRDGVERFGGRIDKFTGDGAMALFGAPVAYEDHARRACAAALGLREDLARYGRELERERSLSFVVRMGLNSGEVVAGPLGDDRKMEYTAVGNTVGLAQRMESLAAPGSVYLTAATARLVAGYFDLRDLGPMRAKGVNDEVDVYELVARGALRTPLEVAAARGFSRFVGRDDEIAALEAAFARASDGDGQVVGIVAGPGVGKSRLTHEFAESCRVRGVDAFAAHGLAHAQSVPFVPVLEILRSQFGILDQDDPATARSKVEREVQALDASLDDALPLLWDFLGVADPDRAAPAIDPEARQRQIFAALDRLRQARSARGPVVIVVEDLHWLDPGSHAFLENLVAGVPGTRLLVVTTFRPEFRAPWADRPCYRQLVLSPLGEEASDELLRDLLGPHPSLDGVAGLVRERTGGNPFFIEEVIQGLVESGSLSGQRGAYELASTIGEVRIPATVQAVLAARIDRLPEAGKALVQTAAVIGRQFSRRLVGHVGGLAEDDLDAALRMLVDGELVYETAPEGEYAFKHALTEEVAYGSQLARRRARVHATVARAIAELDTDKLDERAALIARHHELGGEVLEAARWHARAATWAGFSHPLEAVRHWRRVRSLADELDQSAEVVGLGINARLMLLSCHWRLGAASEDGPLGYEAEAAATFQEGEKIADAAGQVAAKVIFLTLYGAVRVMSDGVEDGYMLTLRAVRLADETGDPGLRVNTRIALGWTLFVLGRAPEAAAMSQEIETLIGSDRSMGRGLVMTSPYGWCRMARAFFAGHCDRLDGELAAIGETLDLLGEEGDDETQAHGRRNWAVIADLVGADPDAAAEQASLGLKWAEEAGGPWSRIFNREGVAVSHAQGGRWLEALEVVDEALAIASGRRIALANVPFLLATRARAQLGLGDARGARSSAEEAVRVAVRCGVRHYEVRARLELARAILADEGGSAAQAVEAELDRASEIVSGFGLGAYAPQIHVERAQLAKVLGDEAAYGTELREAHQLFVAVGAPGRAAAIAPLVGAG